MKYQIQINNGNANLGVTQKTISVNEVVEKVDIKFLAHHIHLHNPLIPEQVAKNVLENYAECSSELMAQGYAIPMMSGQDVYSRHYGDIHIKGGNINLARARELMPDVVTDEQSMVEHAAELVQKVEQKFTDALLAVGASVTRVGDIKEVAFVEASQGSGSSDDEGGNSGSDSGSSNSQQPAGDNDGGE